MNKLESIVRNPLTEVVVRGAIGTLFVVKSIKHFRKGNWVRGIVYGATAGTNLISAYRGYKKI